MKKNLILTVICAICALAITFVACKKETEEGTKNQPNKAVAGLVGGVYDAATFDYDAEYFCTHFSDPMNLVAATDAICVETDFSPGHQNCSYFDIKTRLANDPYTSYSSFCGHIGSQNFGNDRGFAYFNKTDDFKTARPNAYNNIVTAFDYIVENWGSLNKWVSTSGVDAPQGATKTIAAMAAWVLLEDGATWGNIKYTSTS